MKIETARNTEVPTFKEILADLANQYKCAKAATNRAIPDYQNAFLKAESRAREWEESTYDEIVKATAQELARGDIDTLARADTLSAATLIAVPTSTHNYPEERLVFTKTVLLKTLEILNPSFSQPFQK